jgi:hypothetical protein
VDPVLIKATTIGLYDTYKMNNHIHNKYNAEVYEKITAGISRGSQEYRTLKLCIIWAGNRMYGGI